MNSISRWAICIVSLGIPFLSTAEACAASVSHPAVEAFFASKDPFVQKTVIPNIEKYRKSDATLRFVDAQGRPVVGVAVRGGLRRHQFLFGACPPESKADLDPRFVAAWSGLFNYGVAQNACKWAGVEKAPGRYDFSRVDRMVELCRTHDVTLEYHFLTGYHPDWLKSLPDAEKARRQQAFAREVVRRYKDRIAFFQIYNEDWCTHIARAKVYFDQTEFFGQLTREFPGVRFGVSDCWTLHATAPLPDAATLVRRCPGVAYLAMHAHRPRRLWASPEEMYREFDKYRTSPIKLHLTEFGIDSGLMEGDYRHGTWDEASKAEYFVQLRAVAFSHPAVEAVNHWDMGPGVRSRTYNALLNDDYSPKPAYEALYALIKQRLSTPLDGQTDAAGQFAFRGFHGRYEITLTDAAGHTATVTFAVDPQKTRQEFVVEEAAGKGMSVRGK